MGFRRQGPSEPTLCQRIPCLLIPHFFFCSCPSIVGFQDEIEGERELEIGIVYSFLSRARGSVFARRSVRARGRKRKPREGGKTYARGRVRDRRDLLYACVREMPFLAVACLVFLFDIETFKFVIDEVRIGFEPKQRRRFPTRKSSSDPSAILDAPMDPRWNETPPTQRWDVQVDP